MPIVMAPNAVNRGYIQAKARRMAHLIPDSLFDATEDPTAVGTMGSAAAMADDPAAAGLQSVAVPPSPSKGSSDASDSEGVLTNPSSGKKHKYCLGRKSVEDAIAAIGRGECVVVTDDEDRENEGDLILSAELCTPETIAFMIINSYLVALQKVGQSRYS